jgi:drug/metabolite transporter (DMT)-like permease
VSFVATKVALDSAPPWTVVSLRMLMAAACFALWLLLQGRNRRRPSHRQLAALFGLSFAGTGLHYGTQTVGLQWTTASNGSLYAVTGPIFIALLAWVVLGERLTPRRILGIALAVAGVISVIGVEAVLQFQIGNLVGDALVLFSIFLFAVFAVAGKRITDDLGPVSVTAWVTLFGAAWMLPIGGLEVHLTGFELGSVAPAGWMAIAFLGLGCTFLAVLSFFTGLRQTDSQTAGVYLYAVPPITALVAWAGLGERLDLGFFLGAVLILCGVRLTETGRLVRPAEGLVVQPEEGSTPR